MKKIKLNQKVDFAIVALTVILFGSSIAYIMIALIQR